MKVTPWLILLSALTIVGCGDRDDPKEDTEEEEEDDSNENEDDTEGEQDDSEEPDPANAKLSGTVTVVLYTTGSDGEREFISWDDADALTDYDLSVWPFGKIFIGAYSVDSATGNKKFWGDFTLNNPTRGGDAYSLDVEKEDGPGDVYVYAHLDWYPDRVLGSWEPQGHYPALIPIEDGAEVESVDVTILAPIPYGGGGGCGDVDGDGSGDAFTITGDVLITISYAGGDVATFLQTTDGEGPYWVSWATPTADGGGASTPYTITTCGGMGSVKLRGAWDTNGNELIDATDRWGGYISAPDVDANPITQGYSDLTGYDIQIPLGNEDGFSIVPFTGLSGQLSMDGGANFDEPEADGGLPSGSTLYVAALKYRPSDDLAVSNLGLFAYSYDTYSWSDLAGQSAKNFSLNVPSDTIVYLWSFADEDNDGILNEPGEAVASGGTDSSGKLPTGTTGASGLSLTLKAPPSGDDTGGP